MAASFNERSVIALQELCEETRVLVPRPYAPPVLSSFHPRWKAYRDIPSYELRNNVAVYRPAYPQLPKMTASFCIDGGAFLWCRRIAQRLHRLVGFDAILSFDLLGAGGIAWKIGRDLEIPAVGWAIGNDVRVKVSSAQGRAVARALKRLDLVFYQSRELLDVATTSFFAAPRNDNSLNRHIVMARGIPEPPQLQKHSIRHRVRQQLGVSETNVLVVYIGRIVREKGIHELSEAVLRAAEHNPKIRCAIIGSDSDFDETELLVARLYNRPGMDKIITLVPACGPDRVWDYLCAADIFAFTSYREGMPNSLLEAMAMGVPAVAFSIPPVLEIESDTGALVLVPPFDSKLFSEALLHLAASPAERTRIGAAGKREVLNRYMIRKTTNLAFNHLQSLVGSWRPSYASYSPPAATPKIQTSSAEADQ
jgi:teichuronic acid biosynthesis glycosyltransferase TuaC